MKTVLPAVALLLIAGAAEAQTTAPTTAPQTRPPAAPAPAPGAAPAPDLTRDLNSGPPKPATYIAPAPAPTAPAATPAPTPIGPANPASPPGTQPMSPPATAPAAAPRAVAPAPTAMTPPAATPPVVARRTPAPTPMPTVPTPTRSSTPTATAPAPVAPIPAPAPAVSPAPAPAAGAAGYTTLDAAARAALPFTVTLPAGFTVTTGRPGPDFRIYTIRRGETSFAMVYAGPASQFPIYGGELVEAGGRATVISTEEGQRHPMEHLFVRAAAPREIHVWTMTLSGADRLLAEQIAQSVDVR